MGDVSPPCGGKGYFSSTDSQIWELLLKWVQRRHPTKGARWVKDRYFHTMGGRSWVFADRIRVTGDYQLIHIFRAMTVPIVRHVKIQASANPFDPQWEQYFARRHTAKISKGCPAP